MQAHVTNCFYNDKKQEAGGQKTEEEEANGRWQEIGNFVPASCIFLGAS
jgi:hypothetical protein